MTESATRITPLIASQERAAAALQPANPSASSSSPSVQCIQTLPRNAATLPSPVLPHDSSSANRALSFAAAQSAPAADDAASPDDLTASLQARLEELQAANAALAARCDSGRRGYASDVWPAADAGRLYGVVDALLSNQQAMQERHEATVQKLQELLLSNQRSLQEALASSHSLAVAACCVSAALLGVLLVRARL